MIDGRIIALTMMNLFPRAGSLPDLLPPGQGGHQQDHDDHEYRPSRKNMNHHNHAIRSAAGPAGCSAD
jgi:hypothetical protein